ncbi:MAG: transcriptional regulator [Clostridia bacterium]|nr:transcriptional regulator [Clostridia bacterium]
MDKTELIDLLKRIGKGIASMFGDNCEVLISDLDNPENSIIAIYNGHVTGRKIGDPLSELGFRTIRKQEIEKDLINYKGKTKEGALVKCSTFHIQVGDNRLALGINYDYTYLDMAQSALRGFLETEEEVDEVFVENSREMLKNLLEEADKLVGKPPSLMSKDDRLKIVSYLDERGAFLVQRGVKIVAEHLNVSRYTIYNYLNEINRNKNKYK